MTTLSLDDVLTIENGADDEMKYFTSVQRAINSLDAWKMQGFMGRTMMDAITSGRCMLAKSDTKDYWGNHIPSRDQVQAGTKGSFGFVVERAGQEWADHMREID